MTKEEELMLLMIKKKSISEFKLLNFIRKSGQIILYSSVLIFYFSFFIITYFSPLIFPEIILKIKYFAEFKDFHNYYNHNYKREKGESIIFLEFGAFIYLYLLMVVSFYKVSTTDPGKIPDNNIWNLSINPEHSSNIITEEISLQLNNREKELISNNYRIKREDKEYFIHEQTSSRGIRYCLTCLKFKPDRCHHCKFCNRCNLKMDHHCPWVGNCIGFHNYKYFVLMVLYGFLNSIYFSYIYSDVIKFLIVFEKIISFKLMMFLVWYIFVIVIMISLFIFICFHLIIIFGNYTTYEYITKVVRGRHNKNEEVKPEQTFSRYSLAAFENFKQVFGEYMVLWFFPINLNANNDGLSFKINHLYDFNVVETV